MIKRIALIVTILLANLGFAQENTPSPYSFYGIGVSKFKGTNDVVNMGGISIYADSTHVNLLNPATFSNQIVTNFQIGLTSSFYKLNAGSTTEKAKNNPNKHSKNRKSTNLDAYQLNSIKNYALAG
ncbi:MAG: hypothetical protein ACOVOQ_12745 [Flavobacterium sp.]